MLHAKMLGLPLAPAPTAPHTSWGTVAPRAAVPGAPLVYNAEARLNPFDIKQYPSLARQILREAGYAGAHREADA